MGPLPNLTQSDILAFQFSSWYPNFASQSIKSTIIKPLSEDFVEYLNADGIFVPEGSENAPATSTLSDSEDGEDEDEEGEVDDRRKHYTFPELDRRIRGVINQYDAVFPKLNFSSPKDASWLLPSSAPLKCTSPAEVYLLLKSSGFINHDLSLEAVFEGCTGEGDIASYELELVLRKWYPIDRARELRCFVRNNKLVGISQRDTNFYDFWNERTTRDKVTASVYDFWTTSIKPKWTATEDYVFDFFLTRDFSSGHILDFNPYSSKTDPLLFSYEELETSAGSHGNESVPELRTINSRLHPMANSNTPAHQHNMVPFDAIEMSGGRDIGEFAEIWQDSMKEASAGKETR